MFVMQLLLLFLKGRKIDISNPNEVTSFMMQQNNTGNQIEFQTSHFTFIESNKYEL